jgi:predicted XRE-type DNA-binding protein
MENEKKSMKEVVASKVKTYKEKVDEQVAALKEAPISARVKAVCHMAAIGFNKKEIAVSLGIPESRVGAVLSSKSAKAQIDKIQHDLFFADPQKMFRTEVPRAFRRIRKVLYGEKTKDNDVLKAADMIFDRALGKPKQEIQHETSSIKQLFEMLDKQNQAPAVEAKPVSPDQVIDAEYTVKTQEQPKDDMDSWLLENLK